MAGVMTIPMLLLELLFMGSMYKDKRMNKTIIAASLAIFILFFYGIRNQIAIGDKEFLKSMIPHHAGALLMCGKASLQDPELKELCKNIMIGQQHEIDFMKAKLKALK